MTNAESSIAAVFVGVVLLCIVLVGAPVGLAVWLFCALFIRRRPVPLGDLRVRRAPIVRSFRVIPATQAACCCQACGWLSAN